MRFDLVIFDCDGVLVDSEPLAAEALARTASEAGFPLTRDECLARFTGISLASVRSAIEVQFGRSLPEDFLERLRHRDEAAFRSGLRAIPGVAEALARLPCKRCVASSGTPRKMRFTLGLTGLLPLFEPHLFSAIEVAAGKPAPDLFLHAAAQMGSEPERCVVIEDSLAGVTAARAARMRALGFIGGSHATPAIGLRLRLAGAARIFDNMACLPELLTAG